MFWFMQGMSLLPAFLVIWSSSTFIVCYIIALLRRDVDVILPYISDTGVTPPESCIFGLMTAVTAFTSVITMYARCKYLEKLNEMTGVVNPYLNQAAFWTGMLSCLGMCFVATFQETAVRSVHDMGAILFFVPGVMYIILQSIVSFRAQPYGSSQTMCCIRAAISTIATLALFPSIICAGFVQTTRIHRHPEDEDYVPYLVSAVCEWVVAFSFVFYFLTFIQDFKMFTLKLKTELVEHS